MPTTTIEQHKLTDMKNIKIAVAGTGYVGLSIATLLAQHHQVTAVDVIPEKTNASHPSKTNTLKNIWRKKT